MAEEKQKIETTEVKLADNQVKLSDGRIVTLKEPTGSSEMIVAAYLSDQYTPDTAGQVIFLTCMVAYCIESIDGTKPPTLRKFEDFINFTDNFKRKDFNKIIELYTKMNISGNV